MHRKLMLNLRGDGNFGLYYRYLFTVDVHMCGVCVCLCHKCAFKIKRHSDAYTLQDENYIIHYSPLIICFQIREILCLYHATTAD